MSFQNIPTPGQYVLIFVWFFLLLLASPFILLWLGVRWLIQQVSPASQPDSSVGVAAPPVAEPASQPITGAPVSTAADANRDDGLWLIPSDPLQALSELSGRVSDRKLRLYACACCRDLWDQLSPALRRAVETLERHADNGGGRKAVKAVIREVRRLAEENPADVPTEAVSIWLDGYPGAPPRVGNGPTQPPSLAFVCLLEVEQETRRRFGHDIFGNLARPAPKIEPTWLTWNDGTVPKFARAIHDAQPFDQLPLLADALEEAGCADPYLLDHCRRPGPHVRGCWVVDLLIGRS